MVLPCSFHDSLHPGRAFPHASPAIKLWLGKQVSRLCYYFIFLPCLCIFMSPWSPPAAVDSQHGPMNGSVPCSDLPDSPPALICCLLGALGAGAEMQWVCSETLVGFLQEHLLLQRTSCKPTWLQLAQMHLGDPAERPEASAISFPNGNLKIAKRPAELLVCHGQDARVKPLAVSRSSDLLSGACQSIALIEPEISAGKCQLALDGLSPGVLALFLAPFYLVPP